jgi:hypothetical protein
MPSENEPEGHPSRRVQTRNLCRSQYGPRDCPSIFSCKGGILLLAYAYYGFDTDPQSFLPGQRLDPLHAAVHFLWGIAGTYVGFVRPRLATPFVLAFAAFYTMLAVLGTFTGIHLGMHLDAPVNLFHWSLVFPAWAVGLYGLWRERQPDR